MTQALWRENHLIYDTWQTYSVHVKPVFLYLCDILHIYSILWPFTNVPNINNLQLFYNECNDLCIDIWRYITPGEVNRSWQLRTAQRSCEYISGWINWGFELVPIICEIIFVSQEHEINKWPSPLSRLKAPSVLLVTLVPFFLWIEKRCTFLFAEKMALLYHCNA